MSCSQLITSGLEKRKGLLGDRGERHVTQTDKLHAHFAAQVPACRSAAIPLLSAGLCGAVYTTVGGKCAESQPLGEKGRRCGRRFCELTEVHSAWPQPARPLLPCKTAPSPASHLQTPIATPHDHLHWQSEAPSPKNIEHRRSNQYFTHRETEAQDHQVT